MSGSSSAKVSPAQRTRILLKIDSIGKFPFNPFFVMDSVIIPYIGEECQHVLAVKIYGQNMGTYITKDYITALTAI